MSFSRYPVYKDSGVDWLGEVPGHWDVKRIKTLTARIASGKTPFGGSEVYVDEGVTFLRSQNVYDEGLRLDDVAFISEAVDETMSVSRVVAGDILLNITGASIGRSCVVPNSFSPANVNQHVCVIRATKPSHIPFLGWSLKSAPIKCQIDHAQNGAAREGLNFDQIGRMVTALPPEQEQTQIAAFLDRETAKIDALVAEQRRLIELLKEKRQAVISHAVTRGLNPDAPMKPSCIEWLGDVPAHWDVLKGALIGKLFGSEQVPEEAVLDEGELPFIKVGSLSRDSFEIESWDYFVDESVAASCTPRSGYIVFPKRGAAIFTNKVNIVNRPSVIDPNLMGWQIRERCVTAFIAYALKCRKLDELADVSTVPQINNKHIAPERFAVPPIEEQHQIVAYLNSESTKFDTLTTEAQRTINLLQERRTALISAAVTGQIDVRGAV